VLETVEYMRQLYLRRRNFKGVSFSLSCVGLRVSSNEIGAVYTCNFSYELPYESVYDFLQEVVLPENMIRIKSLRMCTPHEFNALCLVWFSSTYTVAFSVSTPKAKLFALYIVVFYQVRRSPHLV
jgi:hypothetical protein